MAILVAAVSLGAVMPAAAADLSAARVRRNADGAMVPEAWARLVSDSAGLAARLHTAGLPRGAETTVWWIVFNNPAACTTRTVHARCGAADLLNEAAQPAVVYGSHQAIGPDGRGVFRVRLSVGDQNGVVLGRGLVRPRGAEIHLQLVSCVGYENATLAGGVGYQSCADTQYAVFR
jgi:hypothetical protein